MINIISSLFPSTFLSFLLIINFSPSFTSTFCLYFCLSSHYALFSLCPHFHYHHDSLFLYLFSPICLKFLRLVASRRRCSRVPQPLITLLPLSDHPPTSVYFISFFTPSIPYQYYPSHRWSYFSPLSCCLHLLLSPSPSPSSSLSLSPSLLLRLLPFSCDCHSLIQSFRIEQETPQSTLLMVWENYLLSPELLPMTSLSQQLMLFSDMRSENLK